MVGIGWNMDFLFLVVLFTLLIRWLRLGCRSPRSNDQFDPNYQQAFRDEVLVRS